MDSHIIVTSAASLKASLRDLIVHQHLEEEKEWTQQQLADFNIWADSLGVFAEQHLSITHRLRKNAQVRNLLLQFLNLMQDDVKNMKSLTTGQPTEPQAVAGSNEDSDSSSASSLDTEPDDLNEVKLRIEHTLRQLGRLALRLRAEGAHRIVASSASFTPRGPEGESLVDSFLMFINSLLWRDFDKDERQTREPATDLARPYRVPEYLRTRLQQTMLARWRRICYQRQHLLRLAEVPAGQSFDPETTTAVHTETSAVPMSDRIQITSSIEKPQIKSQRFATESVATTLPAGVKIGIFDLRTRPSASVSTRLKSISDLFPAPPKGARERESFVCPFCGVLQPAKTMNWNTWRSHVTRDLAPYICVQEDCTTHMTTQSTSRDWKSHLATCHAEDHWSCSTCTGAGTGTNSFKSREAFVTHLDQLHVEFSLTRSEINLLADVSKKSSAPLFQYCLFCGLSPDEGDREGREGIVEHMLQDHMLSYALSCLPWDIGYVHDAEMSLSNEIGNSSDAYKEEMLDDEHLRSSETADDNSSYHTASFQELRNLSLKVATQQDSVVNTWRQSVYDNTAYTSESLAAINFILSSGTYSDQRFETGLDLDEVDHHGLTALMHAASVEDFPAIEFLLNAGASTTVVSPTVGVDFLGMALLKSENSFMITRMFELGLKNATIHHAVDLRYAEENLETYLRLDNSHLVDATNELDAIKIQLNKLKLAGEPAAILRLWQIRLLQSWANRARTK